MSNLSSLNGVRGVDHIGFTVPDLEQAHDFLTEVIGCEYLYKLGPVENRGPWMTQQLGVAEDTVMRELRFYKLGAQAIFEVFQYEAVRQATTVPLNSDVGGHHVALYVDDIDEAVSLLRAGGVDVHGEITASTGASQGQRWVYFRAPWGMQFELVSYPNGKAFDHDPSSFD